MNYCCAAIAALSARPTTAAAAAAAVVISYQLLAVTALRLAADPHHLTQVINNVQYYQTHRLPAVVLRCTMPLIVLCGPTSYMATTI